jgi:hypothetical protein
MVNIRVTAVVEWSPIKSLSQPKFVLDLTAINSLDKNFPTFPNNQKQGERSHKFANQVSFFLFFIKLVKNFERQGYSKEQSIKLWPEPRHEITCRKAEREKRLNTGDVC